MPSSRRLSIPANRRAVLKSCFSVMASSWLLAFCSSSRVRFSDGQRQILRIKSAIGHKAASSSWPGLSRFSCSCLSTRRSSGRWTSTHFALFKSESLLVRRSRRSFTCPISRTWLFFRSSVCIRAWMAALASDKTSLTKLTMTLEKEWEDHSPEMIHRALVRILSDFQPGLPSGFSSRLKPSSHR